MTTLAYAEPDQQPVLPVRWALSGLVVFAIATLAERACTWVILAAIFRDREYSSLTPRDIVDHVLPPLVAAALLYAVLHEQRRAAPALTRRLTALCAMEVVLALISTAYWSITVFPRVWRGNYHNDGVVWEAELICVRLLPVAWPVMIVIFALRGLPTPRAAAAILTGWAMATWTCAATATAALYDLRGKRAFAADSFRYTVTPAWTLILLPVIAVGVMFWLARPPRPPPARIRNLACVVAGFLWLGAVLMQAWFDERMVSVRDRRFAQLADPANLAGVIAQIITTLVLWQIAPIALLLFLARRPSHVN